MTNNENDVVVISRWQVADRATQRAIADDEALRLRQEPWPDGLLSTAWLLSTEGRVVLRYDHWQREQSYRRHTDTVPSEAESSRAESLGAVPLGAVPLETEPLGAIVCEAPSPPLQRPAEGPFTGCVAVVIIGTDGPERQREAAARIAAVGAQPQPGAIGGHVLHSLDGTRTVLYAEWTSEEAHREVVAGRAYGGQPGIFDGVPGIEGLAMHRYQLYRSVDR